MRGLIAGGAVAGVLLVAGCGGSGSADPPAAQATATTDTTATATAPPSSAFDPTAALFTLADFPSGWVQEPDGADDDEALCSADLFDTAETEKEVTFSDQGNVPQLAHHVGSFAPGAAAAAMQRTRETFASCSSGTVNGVKWTVGATSFPAMGDESFAYLASGETKGLRISSLYAGIRSGDGVVTTAYGDLGSVDTAAAVSYARKALARLRSVQK